MGTLRGKNGIRAVQRTQEMEEKLRIYRAKRRRRILLCAGVVVVITLITYLGLYYRSYHRAEVVSVYNQKDLSDRVCAQYGDGVVLCSGDGVAYWDGDGEEVWNQSCQIKDPVVEVCGETVLVGDRGGNDILVFHEEGLKGEIQTSRPIERLAVSEQGIVAAILTDEEMPLVICYDAVGNILVEHRTTIERTGYPLDVAISRDGKTLVVSYLMMEHDAVETSVVYYNFEEKKEDGNQYVVARIACADTVIPSVEFLNREQAVLVGTRSLYFYEGIQEPEMIGQVAVETEIAQVAYGENRVAILYEDVEGHNVLAVYDGKGREIQKLELEHRYQNVCLVDGHAILFEDMKCAIYTEAGVCRYEGELQMYAKAIYPIAGLNKYMVISAGGMQVIQLMK